MAANNRTQMVLSNVDCQAPRIRSHDFWRYINSCVYVYV